MHHFEKTSGILPEEDMSTWTAEQLKEFRDWVTMRAKEEMGPIPTLKDLEQAEKELEETRAWAREEVAKILRGESTQSQDEYLFLRFYSTMKQAADFLGVPRSTFRYWVLSGFVEHGKTSGGHRRFERDVLLEIKRMMDSGDWPFRKKRLMD